MLRKIPALLAFGGLLLGTLPWPFWALLLVTVVGAWALWHKNALAWLLMIPVGAFHFWVHELPDPIGIAQYEGFQGTVRIQVLGTHVGTVKGLQWNGTWLPVSGRLGVLPVLREPWGTELVLKGRIVNPPDTGKMDWRAYLKGQGARVMLVPTQRLEITKPTNLWARLRQHMETRIQKGIPDPSTQALVQALLLGDRTRLDPEILKAFRRTGTFHLLALSGLHVGLIFSLLLLFFQFLRVPYRLRILASLFSLLGYLAVVGPRPSLVRGVLFVLTFAFAYLMERPRVPLNALGVAGLVSLFFFPFWRWSIGFQLSYWATFGILLWVPVLPRFRPKILHGLFVATVVSVVAQVFLAPLLIHTFQGISLAAPFMNVPLVSLTWLLLAEALLALIFSILPLGLAQPFWALTTTVAQSILWMVRKVSAWPWVYVSLGQRPESQLWGVLVAIGLCSIAGVWWIARKHPIDPWTFG